MKTLIIERKNVYGNELLYPACANAKIFAALTGKKTLSTSDISLIEKLGTFTIMYQTAQH
jgi:hypothetical protein